MRRKIVAGNWKLHGDRAFATALVDAIAAVPAKDGAVRFYLLSDDNFQSSQRTLLLAFDWTPARS